MNKTLPLLLPATGAYLGIKVAEMAGQKGAVGALLGVLGALAGIVAGNKVNSLVGQKKALATSPV